MESAPPIRLKLKRARRIRTQGSALGAGERGTALLTDAGSAAGDERRHAGLELHLAGAGGWLGLGGAGEELLPRSRGRERVGEGETWSGTRRLG